MGPDHNRFEQLRDYVGPPSRVVEELSRQLDSWRAHLPFPLQWSDSQLEGNPDPSAIPADAGLSGERLTSDLDAHMTAVGLEILVVELRARFYYARFILNRIYIFKALHFPQKMNKEDVEHCVSAITAGSMWPLALAPARQKKRLLPHLFTWTQNFIAMLVILCTSPSNECLREICNEQLGPKSTEARRGRYATLD